MVPPANSYFLAELILSCLLFVFLQQTVFVALVLYIVLLKFLFAKQAFTHVHLQTKDDLHVLICNTFTCIHTHTYIHVYIYFIQIYRPDLKILYENLFVNIRFNIRSKLCQLIRLSTPVLSISPSSRLLETATLTVLPV